MTALRNWIVAIVCLTGLLLGPATCPAGDPEPGAPGGAAGAGTSDVIHALGRLEPDLGVIDVTAGAFEQRIQAVLVQEGERVSRDQPLVRLVGYDAQEAEVAWLEERVKTARDQVVRERELREVRMSEAAIRRDQTRTRDVEEIKILEHQILALTAELEYRSGELDRAHTLNTEDVVSEQTYGLKRLEAATARENLNAAKVKLERQRALADLNQKAAQAEQAAILAESRARELAIGLGNLQQELILSQKKLETFDITSPLQGEILTILSRPGEIPSGDVPILKMADIRTMVAIAEVYETALSKVRVGQKAVVTSPALPGKLTGTVVHVSRLIFKRTIKDIDPYQPADYRVAEVRVRLDDAETAARYIQLQVDVELAGSP